MKRLALALALAACGDHGASMDAAAGGDISFAPPPCPLPSSITYVAATVGFAPEGQGVDLDGDGSIDNALGFLAPIANQVLADDLSTGFSRYLFDIQRWDNMPGDAPDVTFVSYSGIDADQPPNTANDFTGSGEFYITGHDFDVNCHPRNVSSSATIANRVLASRAARWSLFVRNIGTIDFTNVDLHFELSSDLATANGRMGAVMTDCGMSRAYLPQLGTGTFLDLVLSQGKQADIDVDGDGKETITYANGQIAGCIDGDGTEIPGAQCACDPRIADGYSMAVLAQGVRCKIDGVLANE